ncbi:MAG TPA: FAD-dependent oxidoreductase, partial [Propionibacteriaceae bacterium]|nr:FAD-dependent oxidoreductase [Propionibacteriaceae bacterium]
LMGKDDVGSLYVHDAGWYESNHVDTRLDDAAVAIDVAARTVQLASGARLDFDDLVIATGARPRTLDLPGATLSGVHMLRRIPDCLSLRESFGEGRRLVVIGAGWIGLEVAAAARLAGTQVTVLEHDDVPLKRALGERMGSYFARLHRDHGVDLRTGVTVSAIEGSGTVSGVRMGDELVPADLVLVGVGAVPNTELAQQAGLALDNGLAVDERLHAAPHVLAVGDVANALNTSLGTRLRVEHWDNAIRQGRLAGEVLLGKDSRYDWQPYFFTDQYDLGMEYVGHSGVDDEVVLRGSEQSGEFIAFWLRDQVVTAAMNVNIWDVNDDLRALVGRRVEPDRLVDASVPLKEV